MLEVVNEAILGHDSASEFCTAALAFLRPTVDGYSLIVACAGHAPPFVLRDGGGRVEEAGICGTLLGVDERAQFHDYTTHLGVGDLLAFWTDGVTERRHSGVLFGEQRLASLIEQLEGRSADEVVQRIDEAVVAFAPGLPDDDVAILAARVTADAKKRGAGPSRFPPDTRSRRSTSRGVRLPDVRIALLVTCLNDAVFPEAGTATETRARVGSVTRSCSRRARRAAARCTGTRAIGREALRLVRHTVDTLEPYEVVVCPSGSCTAMIREQYVRAAAVSGDDRLLHAVAALRGRVFELSELLVDRLGTEDVGAELHARAVVPPDLPLAAQPRGSATGPTACSVRCAGSSWSTSRGPTSAAGSGARSRSRTPKRPPRWARTRPPPCARAARRCWSPATGRA